MTTDQGRTAFLEHADRIAADCDVAVGKMQELSADGGKIDIGYIFPLAGHYIPHKVREFLDKEENKNVVFNFWQNHTPAIAAKVRTGELDIGFGGYLKKRGYGTFSTQCTGAGDHYTKGASACRNPGNTTFRDESLSGDWL